jgi:hypothetical protein
MSTAMRSSFALLLAGCALTGNAQWPGSSSGSSSSSSSSSSSTSSSDSSSHERPSSHAGGSARRAKTTSEDLTRPGNCDPAVEKRVRPYGELKGVCWDPPGHWSYANAVTHVAGRREVKPDVFWFDMPKEGVLDTDNCVRLGVTSGKTGFDYLPYEEDGLPRFAVPDFTGKPLAEALDAIDALDRPACITVHRDGECDKPDGIVCKTDSAGSPIDVDGRIRIVVSTDVYDRGTPKETRRLRDLTNKPTEQVRATLSKVFANVEVVEADLPCERGIVCDIDPPVERFYPASEKITLKVRRAKR